MTVKGRGDVALVVVLLTFISTWLGLTFLGHPCVGFFIALLVALIPFIVLDDWVGGDET